MNQKEISGGNSQDQQSKTDWKRRVCTGLHFLITQTYPFLVSLLMFLLARLAGIIDSSDSALYSLVFIPSLILAISTEMYWTRRFGISSWWSVLFLLLQPAVYFGAFIGLFALSCSLRSGGCSF